MKRLFEKLNLYHKFIMVNLLIIAFFSITLGLITRNLFFKSLEEELRNRGKALGNVLRDDMLHYVLYDDAHNIKRKIDNLMKMDHTIKYIAVTKISGEILAHSFDGAFPEDLKIILKKQPDKNEKAIILQDGNEMILNTSVVLMEETGAMIHFGLSAKWIGNISGSLSVIFPLVTVIVMLIAIIFSIITGRTITRPLSEITLMAEAVGRGEVTKRLEINSGDEIGRLASSFNKMLDDIERAKVELEQTHRKMIQTEKLAAMGTFVAGIAHQINNPIAGIRGCYEMRNLTEDPKKRREYMDMAYDGFRKIEEIINQLMAFTRISPELTIPFDLNNMVSSCLGLLKYSIQKKDIKVVTNLANEKITIKGDLRQIESVFMNLFMNAVQAIEEKGEIVIETSFDGQRGSFSIADNGCGIPEEDRKRIFDPFFTTKKKGEGTGLGLYLSYLIVEKHRGEINFHSVVGKGTKFVVYLPAN